MTGQTDPMLAALLDPASAADLTIGQWDLLLRRLRLAELTPRFAVLADEAGLTGRLPAKVRDHLLAGRRLADQHARIVRWEINRLRRALAPTGAPVVLLKGTAYIAAGLPPARGRLVSDVDILVPEARLADVEQALARAGWAPMKLDPYDQRYYRTWMHELPPLRHRDRGSVLDVHHTILPKSGRLRPDPAKLLSAARPVGETGLLALAPADMVLHSAAHLFQDGDLAGGLRDLLDLADLLSHFGRADRTFWDRLVPRAIDLNLPRPLYYALHFVQWILAAPVPPPTEAAAARAGKPWGPVAALMDRLAARALLADAALQSSWRAELARFVLYVRSHWLRMPPLLLAQHLARKALRRWVPQEETSE